MKNSIKVERARNNMTQAQLADKADVTRQTINAIETAKYMPSAVLAFKLAKIFGVRVDELFELEEGD